MKVRKLMPNLLLAVGSILFTIILLEGGARLLLGVRPQPERFSQSPSLGWVWTPGYDRIENYKGNKFRMTVSQQGLRNAPIAVPKPDDTFRILALGDSVVAAPGVEDGETFVRKLEHLLQADSSDITIEVVNAGTDDYGSEQELIWLREQGLALEPDLVILHIYLNDSRSFPRPSPIGARLTNFMNRHSAVYTLYRDSVRNSLVEEEAGKVDFRFRYREGWEAGNWKNDSAALTKLIQSADDDWGLAWYEHALLRIEDSVLQIAELARENGFSLMLVIIPVQVQVYADVDTPLDLTGPQYDLVRFANEHELPVLDLLPLLRENRQEDLFIDQVHLLPAGHTLMASGIERALREHGLVPAQQGN